MSTDHLKKPKTQAAMARIGDIMANQIAPTFQGGALVTVIVRFPGEPECDFFMSDRAETIGELRAFLDRCDKRDQLDHTTDGVTEVHAPSLPLNVKRALDIAEGRLMTLDAMNHPAIPRNDDVLAVIREALASGVTVDGHQTFSPETPADESKAE